MIWQKDMSYEEGDPKGTSIKPSRGSGASEENTRG